MGTWGHGLYSNDFAMDLKASITAACRLPFEAAEIVQLLIDMNPQAQRPQDEEFTIFWLIFADQLQKKGIESDARQQALGIIRDGTDLAMLEQLGMSVSDLRKRAKALTKLEESLSEPPEPKKRKTLKKPQPLLVQPGEIYVFPVDSRANACNPYFANPEEARFIPVGWSSCLILAAGHAFGYLAWYQVAPSLEQWAERPDPRTAVRSIDGNRIRVGTLSRTRLKRLQLELVGTIEPPKVAAPTESLKLSAVVSDIGVSNALSRWLPAGSVPPKPPRFGL